MDRRFVLSLALAAGLAAPAAFAAEPEAPPPALTSSMRDRLDRLALRLPGDTLGGNIARSVEELPEWVYASGDLTPEDEARRAADAHTRVLAGRPAVVTPAAAQHVFDRLVAELPSHLKPHAFHYRLTVLDRPERDAFTTGGGEVYVTRPELDDLLADPDRGEAALAFVLAGEIGRDALGHTRRGWEWQDAVDGPVGFLPLPSVRRVLAGALGAGDGPGRFAYSPAEREEADCFALHLCRNAGFDPDAVLDPARSAARGRLDDKDDGQTKDISDDGTLLRLKRLLMERDGLFDDETTHGLFVYDRDSGRLARCGPRQVGPGERPIIFVHGLRGTKYAFEAYLSAFGKQAELAGRPLLVFRYPNNESLSRCGEFLAREMRNCVAEPDRAVFVCHSAGGLVFRWYAEVRGGRFDRTIFLAVPHGGTGVVGFKIVADVGRFVLNLPHGLDFAVAEEFSEGSGEIAQDLAPDSLFLRRLDREKHPVEKYQTFYGEVFSFLEGIQYQIEFGLAVQYAKDFAGVFVPFPGCQDRLRRAVGGLTLPDEIAHGDFAVSVASARLPGVEKTTGLPLTHEAFRTNPEMIRRVLDAILER